MYLFILTIWRWHVWGRKDPMLPGNGIGDTDKTCFTTDANYKFKYGSEGLNTTDIKEYIRNPHKFNIKPEMDGKYLNLWSTDNERTDANDDVVIKSVYDPSPVGYSLPASNAFTGFTTTGQRIYNQPDLLNVKGDYDEGYYCYTKPGKTGNTFFFYADGLRMHSQGNMRLIPSNGFEWTSGVLDSNTGRNFYFHIKMINPLKDYNKNFGFPVRSAEEKKWKYVCCSKLQMVFGLREVYDM